MTHHLDLVLGGASYLVRLLEGRIALQGRVEDLRSDGKLDAIKQDAMLRTEDASPVPQTIKEFQTAAGLSFPDATDNTKTGRKLVKDEERATGNVKWSVYKTYLVASGYWVWPCVAVAIVLYQLKCIRLIPHADHF